MRWAMLSITSEQLQDFLHAKLACTTLATFNGLICQFALLLLQV
jgi:hypothetical protein